MGLVDYFIGQPKDLKTARQGVVVMVTLWVVSLVLIAVAVTGTLLGADTSSLIIEMILLNGLATIGIGVSREAYYRLGGAAPGVKGG